MEATFYVRTGERSTARDGAALRGRDVRYGKLGRVGVVEHVVVVDSGRALRLHVALSRVIRNPDRHKFRLAPEAKP